MSQVIVVAQPSIMTSHFADDCGDMVFTICREGGEREMGQRVTLRKPFLAEVSMKFLRYLTEEEYVEYQRKKYNVENSG